MLTFKEVLTDAENSPGFEGIRNVDVYSRGNQGQTALHWMAVLGDDIAIQILLDAGAGVDVQDIHGNTALHEAVFARQHTAARALLLAGANAKIKNHNDQSPQQAAEMEGYMPVIQLLCQWAP